MACGFYWTEGIRGLGWAFDAIPTLKGGSTVGIPSPPAIILPDGIIVKLNIQDAERIQGFEAGWTQPAELVARPGMRWKLVGNAVTVGAAEWIGRRIDAAIRVWRRRRGAAAEERAEHSDRIRDVDSAIVIGIAGIRTGGRGSAGEQAGEE